LGDTNKTIEQLIMVIIIITIIIIYLPKNWAVMTDSKATTPEH